MKRILLVAIVLFAAMATIYFMVSKWQKDELESVTQNTEERDVLGLSPSGAPASGASASAEPAGAEEAEAAMAATGSATDTDLEAKARTFSEDIVHGLTSRVLKEANDELNKQITVRDLNLSFESVTSSLGSFLDVESVSSSEENGYRAVTATLRYEGNDGATIRYIFDKNDKLAGIWFDNTRLAASVEKGSRYDEQEVTIGHAPFLLDGILTLPTGASTDDDDDRKPPVVLLLSDRDDADADGTIGESLNKPLRDVAHGLALRGVASLRFNRRLFQYPDTADAAAGVREYLIKDAWSAIDSLYHEGDVDTKALFVLAWGQSAEYLEPILERRIARVKGAILIGAKPMKHSDMSYVDPDTKTEADANYFMSERSTFPLILLQGDLDYETPLFYFERWQTLFTGRAHTDYHQYRGLGHYLWPGSENPSAADYDAENHVSNQVITDIANWCAAEGEPAA